MKRNIFAAVLVTLTLSLAACSFDAEGAKDVLNTSEDEFKDVLNVDMPTIRPEDAEKIKDAVNTSKDTLTDVAGKISSAVSSSGEKVEAAPEDASQGQIDAIAAAKKYLEGAGFSKQALIDKLTEEFADKFKAEDAKFAVNFLESISFVDWKEQAAKAAKQYLSGSSFTKEALIEKLTSEGFSSEEAEYGASQAGL